MTILRQFIKVLTWCIGGIRGFFLRLEAHEKASRRGDN